MGISSDFLFDFAVVSRSVYKAVSTKMLVLREHDKRMMFSVTSRLAYHI